MRKQEFCCSFANLSITYLLKVTQMIALDGKPVLSPKQSPFFVLRSEKVISIQLLFESFPIQEATLVQWLSYMDKISTSVKSSSLRNIHIQIKYAILYFSYMK